MYKKRGTISLLKKPTAAYQAGSDMPAFRGMIRRYDLSIKLTADETEEVQLSMEVSCKSDVSICLEGFGVF